MARTKDTQSIQRNGVTLWQIVKNGKTYTTMRKHGAFPVFCFEKPEDAAPYWESSRGEENLYFGFHDDSGKICAGFSKIL